MKYLSLPLFIIVLSITGCVTAPAPKVYPPGVKQAPPALQNAEGEPVRLLEDMDEETNIAIKKDGAWRMVVLESPVEVPSVSPNKGFTYKGYTAKFINEFSYGHHAVKRNGWWVVEKSQ